MEKVAGKTALDGTPAVEFEKLRHTAHTGTETSTPRMGGVLIWVSVMIVTLGVWLLHGSYLFPSPRNLISSVVVKRGYLSCLYLQEHSWVSLTICLTSILRENAVYGSARDFSSSPRLIIYRLVVYAKLGVDSLGIPGDGTLTLGALIVPLFVIITLGLYAGGVIDGIDGLAGGVFSTAFMAYAGIAYFQNQINLAAFSATLTGAILAFSGSIFRRRVSG